VSFSSSSANPTASSATRTISWQVIDKDAANPGTNATSTVVTTTVTITAVNNVPTLTAFTSSPITGVEDSVITLRYSDLIGSGSQQAQVADADGTVTALGVRELLSGSLRIGADLASATA
jgi:hypothetical protein